ncbi:TetR/AcrR family transcriptional regulator [Tsukamurella sp. 8F]|uniref:TetR/AcrR family transcriptional regulator n=1 Tax=unclassified Tsukamurella TaxID=2633480 RepID=UPI0023B95B9D|nr:MULTISPECIES: TetR/AcrR family transcriptional regulator [unclassified Tsukamurella]MDF0528693.1 TetR/AcrR family transcriptional regulator [Tsukamurella sp. 8J]MDF0585655.1 TetR/AcrR family transcriptional regulator [Tsukamurella sp. 8F]
MTNLTREKIVSTARTMIERDGFDGLSMRRLAAQLDSSPMGLYHHIGNKSGLLGLIVTQVADEIDWVIPDGAPRDRMVAVGVDTFRMMMRMPWIVPILARGTHVGRGALESNDCFLAAALEQGASDEQAVHLWRAVWGHVVGEVTVLCAMGQAQQDPPWTSAYTELPEAPTMSRMLPELPAIVATYAPDETIADLIDGTIRRWAGS